MDMESIRRNNLAFEYLARKLLKREELPSMSLAAVYCGIDMEVEYRCFLRDLFKEMESRGYKHQGESLQFPSDFLSSRKRDEIAWAILVGIKYDQGIQIGKNIRRNVGNEAKFLGISFEEALEFAGEVARAVLGKALYQ